MNIISQYDKMYMMIRIGLMGLIKIDKNHFDKTRELYFRWKDLNGGIKEFYTRGVNLHEGITEPICCYVNGFYLSLGQGSEDAIIPSTSEKVQVKGSSNFDSDLTSFGPYSEFDYMHFVRLKQSTDEMYLYDIPVSNLKQVKVNSIETFGEQQAQGRRPRFSVINKYIDKYNIQPYAIVDMNTGEIKR